MPLDPHAKFPNRRAYVVKMRSDAKGDAFVGRVENIVTGRQQEFASGRELLDSIARDLATCADESSDEAALLSHRVPESTGS